VRSVLGPIGRWFLRPTSVGVVYVVALTLHAASRGAKADEALGGQTRSISEIVQTRFGSEVTRMTLSIIATAMVVGAVCGFIAGALVRMRDRLARVPERSVVSLALGSFVAVVALHGLIEAWAMAQSPQLYADVWYAFFGLARWSASAFWRARRRSGDAGPGGFGAHSCPVRGRGRKEWSSVALSSRRAVLRVRCGGYPFLQPTPRSVRRERARLAPTCSSSPRTRYGPIASTLALRLTS
jgi:hypothetical protein